MRFTQQQKAMLRELNRDPKRLAWMLRKSADDIDNKNGLMAIAIATATARRCVVFVSAILGPNLETRVKGISADQLVADEELDPSIAKHLSFPIFQDGEVLPQTVLSHSENWSKNVEE